ncbi:hypothetical protein [Vibrio neptunius]|uniref:hypothetical protein n=1 Tax=Vibrio neptunius TaxID=170651 RepID=UPI0019CF8789|nr:hypothetical protein [Vibrio neptunius]MBN3575679.1 hypothetical protein [Vibrio neptunius]
MSRVNTQETLVRFRYAQKLMDGRDEFVNQKVITPTDQPPEPFMQVTDDIISIRDARHTIRSVYLVPVVVVFWLLSIFFINDLGLDPSTVRFSQKMLNHYKLKESEGGYFSIHQNQEYSFYKTVFDEEGSYSIISHIKGVRLYGSEGQKNALRKGFIATSITVFFTILITVFFMRTPRPENIFFDRKRGIVYTWFYGRVAACRFEHLGFLEKSTGIVLYLYAENRKGKDGYDMVPIRIQPTGKIILNTARDNNDFFQQIFNFMENGKSAVITGEKFYRPQPKTYFMIDKRPEPFEARLEKLLQQEHVLPKLYRYLQE